MLQQETQESDLVRSIGDEADLKLKLYGNAKIMNWFDNHGERLRWFDSRYREELFAKFKPTLEGHHVNLKIFNLTSEDAGNYTFTTEGVDKTKQQVFQLFVKDVPKLRMTNVRIKPSTSENVSCHIFGYPYSKVSIRFSGCENEIKCSNESTLLVSGKSKFFNLNAALIDVIF